MSQVASLQDDNADGARATVDTVPAIVSSSLPMRKRKQDFSSLLDGNDKRMKTENEVSEDALDAEMERVEDKMTPGLKPLKRPPMSKAREIRLEQNRKAARESRKRKKIMVEELQRSVMFFTRANATLKQQNDELQHIILQAQSRIQGMDNSSQQQQTQASASKAVSTAASNKDASSSATTNTQTQQLSGAAATSDTKEGNSNDNSRSSQVVQDLTGVAQTAAQAAATQAIFQHQGFSPSAARAAAQTFVGPIVTSTGSETKPTTSNNNNNVDATAGNVNVPFAPAVSNPWPFVMVPLQLPFPGGNNLQPQQQQQQALNQMYALQIPFLANLFSNNPSIAGLNFPMMQLAAMNNSSANNNTSQENQNSNVYNGKVSDEQQGA